jgi:hypothetical protein
MFLPFAVLQYVRSALLPIGFSLRSYLSITCARGCSLPFRTSLTALAAVVHSPLTFHYLFYSRYVAIACARGRARCPLVVRRRLLTVE